MEIGARPLQVTVPPLKSQRSSGPRIIFAGTPQFAAVMLAELLLYYPIAAVYTQPDRPSGRGRKLVAGEVKQLADMHSIPVYQPHDLRDKATVDAMRTLAPDLLIVVAFGLILPPKILSIPTFGCINVHASLLPRWRGASPIQHAILAGKFA